MELRPYQQEAKDAIFEQWDSGVLKTLLVLPTGCGKTVVFAKVTEDCVRQGSRVLILAHRGELLDQAADKLKKTTGLGCAVEKAESSCQGTWFRVVVGSVQTLMREKRLNSFPSDYFDTIIIDEAHHCISDSYQRVLQHFSGAHVLGVTATPDRGDMKNLGTYFESLAYEYTLPKAIKEGYEFDGGLITSVEAVGRSEVEQESGYKGPTTKEMDRYYAQLVVIDKALINKLDVDTANITYATIKNLEVTKERVEEIYGEYGEFQKLTVNNFSAANGRIDILASNYANIKNLLSGSAGIGDLQNIHLTSDNAVIDTALIRTAVMESVSIADLLAGTISTNKFKIMSDDGGIQISGATQQWKDDNGVVRMQAGRDAQGSFTFELFDETGKGVLIDSTGVQPGAIADGLIVNEMVSDTANIAASKLDIDSLFTAINDSTQVIKSNRIWLDDSGQSLNQAYTKMTQNITEIEQTAGSASDSASAAADAAKKALETLSGISTLDAMSASLNNDAHVVHTYTDGTGGDYSSWAIEQCLVV